MAKTLAQLTPTQQAAYAEIKKAGVWYSYNGISRATIAVLEREGFVTIEWTVSTTTNYRSKRTRTQCDWKAVPVITEKPKAEEPKAIYKKPHAPAIVRLIKQELGFERANMPEHGGFVVSRTLWEMQPVAFITWAYAEGNSVARELSDEVAGIADLLKMRGYVLHGYSSSKNHFFVVPESLREIA